MLCRVQPTALSRWSPHCVPDAAHTHLSTANDPELPLFWSENESLISAELSASESSSLKYFVLHFSYFLSPNTCVCTYISNISCAWADDSRVSQPTSSAAVIFIHHYVQPVSLPSEQGQALQGDLRVQSSALNFSCRLVLDHTNHVLLES